MPSSWLYVQTVRRAAAYLGCGFFELHERVQAGEGYWLDWASAFQHAEVGAYGFAWPVATVGALLYRPTGGETTEGE